MEQDIEIIPTRRVAKKRVLFFVCVAVLVFLVIFFGARAYTLTKKVIMAQSGDASPLLSGGLSDQLDFSVIAKKDRRINILLLGVGTDDHPGADLTDTMIVVSIDALNKSVAMMSIPRDLYVAVDDMGSFKINSVFYFSKDYYDSAEKALAVLKETVGEVLGVPINYFVRVDFNGFEQIINILGGVEIDIPDDFYDPYYPDDAMLGYDPLYLTAGTQTLDGEMALKYARSRQTTSDFDRARRQQDILVAVKKKVLAKDIVFSASKINQLINAVGENISTDLQIGEISTLLRIIQDIDPTNISTKVIDDGEDGLVYADRYDEMYVLVPYSEDFSNVHEYAKHFFRDPLVVKESARISVKNGTTSLGLGLRLGNDLQYLGYNIVDIDNAEKKDYQKTFIYDYSGGTMANTVSLLKEKLGSVPVIDLGREDGLAWDLEIVIGSDYFSR